MPDNRSYNFPTRNLVSQSNTSLVQPPRVPRARFLNNWNHKAPIDVDYLYPIMCDEIIPGDHMTYDLTIYARMSTPLFPIMDQQEITTFFFFVPCRLVWTNWVRMMGEQDNPADSIAYTIPQVVSDANGFVVGSIYDHFTLPTVGQVQAGGTVSVNSLPLRAYNLIYNTWFRDQNIIDSASVQQDSNGPDAVGLFTLRKRASAHDYFTTLLPAPQKFTAPTVPLGGTAPILGIGIPGTNATGNAGPQSSRETLSTRSYDFFASTDTAGALVVELTGTGASDRPEIYADLSAATGVAINTFRQAFQIQELLERDARGGTRYTELIRSHFGVVNPDFRLQRPEYIGGGKTPLNITPIAQTTPNDDGPLGALGGTGTAVGHHRASYAATEHGYVIGLVNVRSELSYQQGLHKMWTRATRYDIYWPELAMLGEQAVLRGEIYYRGDGNDGIVLGYQERWHELRTKYSTVVGIMRSTSAGTIDMWHLARRFVAAPALNQAFIEPNTPMDRVLAAAEQAHGQQYICDMNFRRTATRPIPVFGTPASLGRF